MLKKLHNSEKRMIANDLEKSLSFLMEVITRLMYAFLLFVGLPFMLFRMGIWYFNI